jgi:GT2 family glycosyltransferase
MSELAPVVLFVFARPEHTRRTIEALALNELADQSDLIIYSDDSRNESDREKVKEVRDIAYSISGFQSVTVIERECNYGLARNINDGVTEVCNQYGRIIVLEDDLITSPFFLNFMNEALNYYADQSQVWHVSGWNFPINHDGVPDFYFWRIMNCWGWATWSDRWSHYKKDPQHIVSNWSIEKRLAFDVDGVYPFYSQVLGNYLNRKNTWAIFWYASIFENGGLCLTPRKSLVQNIGEDGSGTHAGSVVPVNGELYSGARFEYPEDIYECKAAVEQMELYANRNMPYWRKLLNYVSRYRPFMVTFKASCKKRIE